MSIRTNTTTTYEPARVIQPIYTGGDVSLDGQGRVLATCLGEEALLTNLHTGELLARIDGDGEGLTALSITPTASHLIACSRSLSMRIYALQRHEGEHTINPILLRTLKPHMNPVTKITIDGTGTLIATGGADSVVKIWDIRGGYITHTFRGHTGVISALHFFEAKPIESAPMEKNNKKKTSRSNLQEDVEMTNGQGSASAFRLASGSEDGKIRIWDLAKRKPIATLDSHVSVVRGLDFSSESNTLASASRDKTVIVWDMRLWKPVKVIPILEVVEDVKLLASGTVVACGGEHGRVRLWNVHTAAEVTQEQKAGGEGDAILQLILNVHQQFLLSVHNDQSLILHSTSSLHSASTFTSIAPLPISRRISGTHDEIIDLAYVTQNRSLLALATNLDHVRLVSLVNSASNAPPADSPDYFGADVALLSGHEDIIICLAVDWSGCWLATGAKDNTARLWRIDRASNSYECYTTFTGHAESIGAISLPSTTPQPGSYAFHNPLEYPPSFLLTGSQDRTIKRWTISNDSSAPARALYTRKAHDKDINALALSPTSHLFASASQDRTVKIWSIEEGEAQGVLRGHKRGVWSVAFGPKDTPTISGDSGPAATNRGMILTGSGDKTVKIWSLNDYSCLRTFEGHTNNALKVLWLPPPLSFTQSGSSQQKPSQIASAGADGLVKIWDPPSGECLTTLDNHTDRIWALIVNPDTRALVSGGGDSVVTFWKDTTTQTAAAKDKAATERVEQDQELSNYVHRGQYRQAIALALALNHPARLLSLFQSVLDTSPPQTGSIMGLKAVDEVLTSLSDSQLLSLLGRVRDWNTNARTCAVAQRVLNVVVRNYDKDRMAGLGKRKGGKEVVEALRVYTERHYRRMEELWGESWVAEFLLGEMGGLMNQDVVNGRIEGVDTIMM